MQTLALMAALARRGTHSAEIRNLAVRLTMGLANKDFGGEACACLNFVRNNIRYVQDIYDIETIAPPNWLLKIGAGDCDDMATLLGSLLTAIGHRARFIAVAFEPDQFTHVWVQDYLADGWLDLEPTEDYDCGRSVPLGDAVDFIFQDVCP